MATIKSSRLQRALKYWNGAAQSTSALVTAAQDTIGARDAGRHHDSKVRRCTELGWSLDEVRSQMSNNTAFWKVMTERAKDQERQVREARCRRIEGPVEGTPRYLRAQNRLTKVIARFRCGVANRGEQTWMANQTCRVCGGGRETMEHLRECVKTDRTTKELLEEGGSGATWMEEVERRRGSAE